MRPSLAPTHLLLLHHPLANHIIDRRFHKRRRDRFPMSISIPVIRDERLIGGDVIAEFSHCLQELPMFLRTSVEPEFSKKTGRLNLPTKRASSVTLDA